MARAPFQCLIIPFMLKNNIPQFAIFRRADMGIWQFIAGGGEDSETPAETAKRECFEEAAIPLDTVLYRLDTINSIPAEIFSEEYRKNWGENCFVIKEYAFAIRIEENIIKISDEHSEYKWVSYEGAMSLLKYDSNITALTELRARINQKRFVKEK